MHRSQRQLQGHRPDKTTSLPLHTDYTLYGRTASKLKSYLYSVEQLIAHASVSVQHLFPAALDCRQRGIKGRPVLHIDGHRTCQFQRLVVGLRRQRNDHVKRGVMKFGNSMWRMCRNIDADFVHDGKDEGVALSGTNAGGADVGALADKVAQNGCCHR